MRHSEGCIRTVEFYAPDPESGLPTRIVTGGEDSLVLRWDLRRGGVGVDGSSGGGAKVGVPIVWGESAERGGVVLGSAAAAKRPPQSGGGGGCAGKPKRRKKRATGAANGL